MKDTYLMLSYIHHHWIERYTNIKIADVIPMILYVENNPNTIVWNIIVHIDIRNELYLEIIESQN